MSRSYRSMCELVLRREAERDKLREWAAGHMCEARLDSYGAEIFAKRDDGQPIRKPDCGECIPCQARKEKK
jgi:hypothetical protein